MKKVYVMASGSKVKIGVAADVQKRAKQLKTGCPLIEIIFESVPLSNAFLVERKLHDEFRCASIGHEWFDGIDKSRVISRANEIVASFGEKSEAPKSKKGAFPAAIDVLFRSAEDRLWQLDEEIREINKDIDALKTQLLEAGFSADEIQGIIDEAETQVEGMFCWVGI